MLLSNYPSSGEPIQLVLAGTEEGPLQLGDFTLTKNIIDQGSNCKDLALKAILFDKKDLVTPITLGYIASWGDKVRHQGTIPPYTNALTFKLHLAYVHPLNKFFPNEEKIDLAIK